MREPPITLTAVLPMALGICGCRGHLSKLTDKFRGKELVTINKDNYFKELCHKAEKWCANWRRDGGQGKNFFKMENE